MIYFLSGPIRSGKTSRLLQWARNQSGVRGIATPDRDGLKVLVDLHENKYYRFQLPAGGSPLSGRITIGNFIFSTAAFNRAKKILASAPKHEPAWLVIDEIGPLELNGQGFEPQATRIIRYYRQPGRSGNLVLVVRDSILNRVIEHYEIGEFRTFHFPGLSTPEHR